VSAWFETPSGILLEIRSGGREANVPFNQHFVHHVDRATRTLVIDIPAELWSEG
jgi:ribosomal 30S subunit maturation factor RimM